MLGAYIGLTLIPHLGNFWLVAILGGLAVGLVGNNAIDVDIRSPRWWGLAHDRPAGQAAEDPIPDTNPVVAERDLSAKAVVGQAAGVDSLTMIILPVGRRRRLWLFESGAPNPAARRHCRSLIQRRFESGELRWAS